MANIVIPHTWAPLEIPTAANFNAINTEIATKFNTYAVQTDVQRTMGVDFLFTDALYDIGKAGATRPRDIFTSRNIRVGSELEVAGDKETIGYGRSPTEGLQIFFGTTSVRCVVGTRVSAGSVVLAHNAYQNTNSVDSWTQALGSNASQLFELHSSGFDLFNAVAGKAVGNAATFWGTPQLSMVAGRLLVGTTVITGSNAGEVVLANTKAIRGVNAAGSGTVVLIDVGASDVIRIGLSGTSIMSFGGPGTISGAVQGEMVLGNNKALRASNAGSTAVKHLISLSTGDTVYVGGDTAIALGNPVATSGAGVGDVIIGNARVLRSSNAAGTAARALIHMAAGDLIFIGGDNVGVIAMGAPATSTGAAAGDVILANNKALRGANAAGTNSFSMITVDASDRIVLAGNGQDILWGRAAIALGGGAAPTLGTIGGSGPAVAAQNQWLRILNDAGQARYIPVWA